MDGSKQKEQAIRVSAETKIHAKAACFYYAFGVHLMTAQTLTSSDASNVE